VACNWYVATTLVQSEERAARELKNQQYETSLPLARTERRRRDGLLVDALRPLFSGYVFVRFDPEDNTWRSICYTRGVRGLLGYESQRDRPMPVPEDQMLELFARLAAAGGYITLTQSRPAYIPPGEMIRIIAGPYRDRVAKVEADRGSRIDALLRFAGGHVKHSLPRDIVEMAATAAISAAVR
jgi:transcriptional antiterminator RfaH